MSLLGFRAANHPQQSEARGARASVDERATDPVLFEGWHERFRLSIDAAALPHNAKLPRFWTPEDDGLRQSWAGERVWCNPPYSDVPAWVRKAWRETSAEVVVMLLPANRTEQGWWQDLVEPFRDRADTRLAVEFLRHRLRFIAPGASRIGKNERPPFGCVLLIWSAPPANERRPDDRRIASDHQETIALPTPSEVPSA